VLRTNPEADGIKLAAEGDSARYLGISEAQLAAMWPDLIRLSQRIHAQPGSGGSEIIPREDSIPPTMRGKPSLGAGSLAPASVMPQSQLPLSMQPQAAASGPVSEMPKAFVCVVCKKASHGSRCPVCSGHVCSEHQVGPEQWCADCANVYKLDVRSRANPAWLAYVSAGTVAGTAVVSLLAAVLAGTSVVGALVGSVLLSSVAVVALVVGRTVWLKRTFLQRRGQVVEAEPAPEPVLPFGLTVQPEPEIAVRSASFESVLPSHQPVPRWVRSELPSVLSFPPPSEPLRPEPHAHPHVAPSVMPEAPAPDASAPQSQASAATRAKMPLRTDPLPPAPTRDLPEPSQPEPAPLRAQAKPAPVEPESEWRPIERTDAGLEVPTFPPPPARPSPVAPLLAATDGASSRSGRTAADRLAVEPAEPPPSSSMEACQPPAAAALVRCRPASIRPAFNACSANEPS
jgi:hypothetical protein